MRYQTDAMGNPISIREGVSAKTLTWGEGRMLLGVTKNASNYTEYTYNVDGLRTKKVAAVNGTTTTTEYVWGDNGLAGTIVKEATAKTTVVSHYDNEGEAIGFTVHYAPNTVITPRTTSTYTYVKNLQGDVIRILDAGGDTVVEYTYDPWGKPTVTGDEDLAALNPCSYRGYDYDEETGYYYLQSRYFDPQIGRFINADDTSFLGVGETVNGFNLFVYCQNSPISYFDPCGFVAVRVLVTAAIGGVVGAVLEIVLQLCQVKKLSKVNWGSVSIEFLNGALTGALIGLGINPVATNLGRTLINMVTSIAHSIRTKAKFWSAIGSAVLAGLMTYAVGRYSAATAVITRTVMQSIIATLKTRFSRFSIRAAGVAIKVVF